MIATGPQLDEAGNEDSSPTTTPPNVDPLHALITQAMRLRSVAADYLAAEADLWRLIAQRWLIHFVAGMLAMIAALVGIIMAIVLFLHGCAGLLSELLGGRPWTGELLIGIVVLATTGLAGWFTISTRRASAHRNILDKNSKRKA